MKELIRLQRINGDNIWYGGKYIQYTITTPLYLDMSSYTRTRLLFSYPSPKTGKKKQNGVGV
jgi:hypothetical protein